MTTTDTSAILGGANMTMATGSMTSTTGGGGTTSAPSTSASGTATTSATTSASKSLGEVRAKVDMMVTAVFGILVMLVVVVL